MEGAVTLIAYILVLVGLIVALVRTAKAPAGKKWLCLYLTELIAICAALCLTWVFDHIRSTGPLAGLTYFAETLYSLGAAVVYVVVLAVSVIVQVVRR